MDEVFGAENFVADITFRKKSLPLGAKHIETMNDYILFGTQKTENTSSTDILYQYMDEVSASLAIR